MPLTQAGIAACVALPLRPSWVFTRQLNIPRQARSHEENDTVKEWIAVLKAADAAARWHVHDRRKGAAEEPYINHLLEVASLVAEATDGKDPNLVIAALLHDAIEDQEVPRGMIAETFGEDVAS